MASTESIEDTKILQELCINIEPFKQFVLNCLSKKLIGECLYYNQLVQQLRVRDDDEETLGRIYVGLSRSVSQLMKDSAKFEELLQGIYSFNWTASRKVYIGYINLLGSMVSSNTTFLVPSFESLVSSFAPIFLQSGSPTIIAQYKESLPQRRRYLHLAFQRLMTLVPSGQLDLFPILEKYFPHKRFNMNIQTEYVSQLLLMCDYLPSLQLWILDLIISKSLEMDVEIVIEETGDVRIDKEVGADDDHDDQMFKLEEENELEPYGDAETDHPTTSDPTIENTYDYHTDHMNGQRIPAEVSEMADKLDAVLFCFIQFIDIQCAKGAEIQDRLFQHLLSVFEGRILSTHKSKFVQFLVFFASTKLERFADAFIQRLTAIFLDETQTPIRRQSAVLYLASYLSRAKFLNILKISDVLGDIVTWCGAYLESLDSMNSVDNAIMSRDKHTNWLSSSSKDFDELGRMKSSRGKDINKHETFYCGVQSACYVLCFYGTEMATLQRMSTFLKTCWENILTSCLEPLRYCVYSVRVEFLKLALHVGMISEECWAKFPVDLVHQQQYPSSGKTSSTNGNPLDSFFPFDPCLLRTLHQCIEVYYRDWTGVPGLSADELPAACEDFDDDHDHELELDNDSVYSESLTPSLAMRNKKCPPSTLSHAYYNSGESFMSSSASSMMSSLAHNYGIDMAISYPDSMPGESFIRGMNHARSSSIVSSTDRASSHDDESVFARHYLNSQSIANHELSQIQGLGGVGLGLGKYQLSGHGTSFGELGSSLERVDFPTAGGGAGLDENGWPIPARRPRQYSIGSTGSW